MQRQIKRPGSRPGGAIPVDAAARRGYGLFGREKDAVRNGNILHLVRDRTANIKQYTRRKCRYMINAYVMQRNNLSFSRSRGDLRKGTASSVGVGLNIIDGHVMNAVAASVLRRSAVAGQSVAYDKPGSDMAYDAIADGHVC